MFIKVTNMVEDRRGDPLIININAIMAVYEDHVDGGSLSTKIYSHSGMTWTVEESAFEVYDLIKSAINVVKWKVGE